MIEIDKVKNTSNYDLTKLVVVGNKTTVDTMIAPKQQVKEEQKIEIIQQVSQEPLFRIY